MTTIAADTWGIPGPTFAALYSLLLLVVAVVVFVGRRSVGASAGSVGATLTPTQVALLRGGENLAVATSLGQLRAAGALDDHARPVGTSTSRDPIDMALMDTLAGAGKKGGSRQVSTLARTPRVRKVLQVMRADLAARGLLRTPAGLARVRSWSLLLWAVVALGAARAVAGAMNDKPVTIIGFETFVAIIVALVATVSAPKGPNAAARAAIADAKRANGHLDPKLQPSWTTYGAAGAGMSIALFGASALLLAEPAFAHTVAANQIAVTGAGGGYGGSGDSGSWSGSSSSCSSGGSSCGGGGGCGGGGCGG